MHASHIGRTVKEAIGRDLQGEFDATRGGDLLNSFTSHWQA
jgi:hypothetical protein